MQESSPKRELFRAGGLLLLSLLFGYLLGYPYEGLLLFLIVFFGFHFYQALRLECWLREGSAGGGPAPSGIWGDIYYHLYRQKKRDKKRKNRLAGFLNQFKKLTEALPDAAVVLSPSNDIEWFNKAAEEVLGLKRDDRGEHVVNFLRHPDFSAYLYSHDYTSQITLPSPIDADRELGVRIVNYGDGQRLLLAQDVSELKQLEKMRNDFVANVSHELKTPLTVLRGYLELIESGNSQKEFEKPIKRMDEQVSRMRSLVDDLLMIARLESNKLSGNSAEFVNVSALLGKVCTEARQLDGCPALILELNSESGLYGDQKELESAFSNLITNAVRYTPVDGKVVVHWSESDLGGHFSVEDTGEGIAARHIPFLTKRFYRVDRGRSREQGGTGLGLSIVKYVLSRHDSELKIESILGKGSSFSCHFPHKRMVQVDSKVVTFL
jgi:two-component system phosphate regulon sensor histidine kinase PhoR